jgi:hypothetical protein
MNLTGKLLLVVALSILVLAPVTRAAETGAQYFVSLAGDDRNPGTIENPLATLEGARDLIREDRRLNRVRGPITVLMRSGSYHLARTFELSAVDSGDAGAPVVYRPFRKEKVSLSGGVEVSGFVAVQDRKVLARLPEAARGRVLQADLRALGIRDFGSLQPRGFGKAGVPAALELFFEGHPMTLARWPNDGWAQVASAGPGSGETRFGYQGDRPARWQQAKDPWLHGYWAWDWADSYTRIRFIDTKTREMVAGEPQAFGFKMGARYYALNLLEELDQPGEWYLDRTNGLLYFWPPTPATPGKAQVSLLSTIISVFQASNISIEGLTIEYCRANAVVLHGGSNTRLSGCTIRNAGNAGVRIEGGTRNGVTDSEIANCGETGVVISGGDRRTLEPGGNFVTNNRIHDFGRWVRTYAPGIDLYGVGNRVAHNLIYNAPHTAILLHGNEHLVEYNEIHHVCLETSDAGAFYMGRDYSERGNVIRYNYFHHLNLGDVQAIYLDDFASGTTVFGNVVYKAGRALQVGGGRDNRVENNLFIDCKQPSVIDARGTSWSRKYFDGTDTTLTDRLTAVRYREPPYSVRYPELRTLYDKNPALPEGNRFRHNISSGGPLLDLKEGAVASMIKLEANLDNVDPGFVDREGMNFQLKKSSPAFKLGFKRIPVERIGPVVGGSEGSLP